MTQPILLKFCADICIVEERTKEKEWHEHCCDCSDKCCKSKNIIQNQLCTPVENEQIYREILTSLLPDPPPDLSNLIDLIVSRTIKIQNAASIGKLPGSDDTLKWSLSIEKHIDKKLSFCINIESK